jgi:hypothetical protein
MCKGSIYAVQAIDAVAGVSYMLHNGGDRQHKIATLIGEGATFNSRGQVDVAYCIPQPTGIKITGMNEAFRAKHRLSEPLYARFVPAGENYFDQDEILIPGDDDRTLKFNDFIGNTMLRVELAEMPAATIEPGQTPDRAERELVTA